MPAKRSAVLWLVTGLASAGLLLALSTLYWIGEGRPGTPAEFRQSVADAGLEVDWDNAGPRGGDGRVTTACGEVEVAVHLRDDVLWVRWESNDAVLDPDAVEAIMTCAGP